MNILVAFITYMCANTVDKIECYDHYVNCSIGYNGVININKCSEYKGAYYVKRFDN